MRALTALLLLAACAAVPEQETPRESFRDPGAVIGSQTNVTAADLAGTWIVRARILRSGLGFGDGPAIVVDGTGLAITHEGFTSAGEGMVGAAVFRTLYEADGPGRWRLAAQQPPLADLSGAPNQLWIFWLDGDRRTMAVGSPDGTYAEILDRAPNGGADRIAAAREILDWYGFDLATLIDISP